MSISKIFPEVTYTINDHANIDVLKQLGDKNGKLTYKNLPVQTGDGTGGHTIKDETTSYPQRTSLEFQGFDITDDSVNDKTIVTKKNIKDIDVNITDANNYFTGTKLNEVLDELFTYANDGKNVIATAITNKGVTASPTDTFPTLADKIGQIPSATYGSSLKKITKLNVVAPYTKNIVLDDPLTIDDICTSCLEYTPGSSAVDYNCDFNNTDSSNFVYDNQYVTFDGIMKCKTNYTFNMTNNVNATTSTEEWNYVLDKSLFNYIDSISSNTGDTPQIILNATPKTQVVTANGDIDLSNVETLTSISWTTSSSGNGKSLLFISNDNGTTWQAYYGGSWVIVDTINIDDMKAKGMPKSVVDALTSAQLETIRNGRNTIRFKYLIEVQNISDIAYNDKIMLTVTMMGYSQICAQSKFSYSYTPATRTLTYTFNTSGTYTINYFT